jgi:cysteine protease ATG4
LANENESLLRVYSTGDGPDVYEDAFLKIARPDGEDFHPTLILVGTRLGIDKITQVYWEALIASLQMKQSVGIAGYVELFYCLVAQCELLRLTRDRGRPSSSHYFIGAQGSFLFYLDPHHTRPALPYYENPGEYTPAEVDSCHTRRLRKLHVREIDPSMLIGFLIRDEEDWLNWRRDVRHVQGKAIINVADHDPMMRGTGSQRDEAIDEVQTLSDDEDSDTILEV